MGVLNCYLPALFLLSLQWLANSKSQLARERYIKSYMYRLYFFLTLNSISFFINTVFFLSYLNHCDKEQKNEEPDVQRLARDLLDIQQQNQQALTCDMFMLTRPKQSLLRIQLDFSLIRSLGIVQFGRNSEGSCISENSRLQAKK